MGSHWQSLVEYQRAGLSEALKFGALCWASGQNIVHSFGGDVSFFGRSTVKLIHMKGLTSYLDQVLNWEQKAVSVASHNAEPQQLKVIKSILAPREHAHMLTPASLSRHASLSTEKASSWFHPCSGEHSAILRACQLCGWSLKDYRSIDHPFHQNFLKYIQSILGAQWHPKVTAKDGCGLATVSFQMSDLAILFANFVKEKDKDWIWEAMVRSPELVGGHQRLDTAILKSCNGQVIAKEGAEGLLGMSIIHPDYPQGLGIIIKLAHGQDPQAMWYLARGILNTLGWELPLPERLFRQNAILNPNIVPRQLQKRLTDIPMRDIAEPLDDIWEHHS